jgi:putative tryptophan/tyrosine transport system substrate-binding protein
MLQTKSLKRRLVIAFMAISLVFTMATLVRGQPSKVRVGVFTPGISLEDVRDGLQQGLTRLGYLEAKNITFIAKKLDVRLFRRDVTNEQEIKDALEETSKGSVDAIFHVASTLVRTHIEFLIKKAKVDKIPLAVHDDALLHRGALVSYGPNPLLVGLQAAALVDKVLRGARPGEIRVETPDRLFLAINRTTAKEIGLNIPRVIEERADRLVE